MYKWEKNREKTLKKWFGYQLWCTVAVTDTPIKKTQKRSTVKKKKSGDPGYKKC